MHTNLLLQHTHTHTHTHTHSNDVKRYREAEVQHGRVAMMASLGYLIGENFPGPFGLSGPANDQLADVPGPAFALLTLAIGVCETFRATTGWVEPGERSLWTLRDTCKVTPILNP